MTPTLASILKIAPSIHVSLDEEGQAKTRGWVPNSRELQAPNDEILPYHLFDLDGDGTEDNPYQPHASDQSPYMVIVRIWWGMWLQAPFYILINDHRLHVSSFGVTADDGQKTILLQTQ